MAADERDILAANGKFYAAFAAGDYAAMDRLWADKLAVVRGMTEALGGTARARIGRLGGLAVDALLRGDA